MLIDGGSLVDGWKSMQNLYIPLLPHWPACIVIISLHTCQQLREQVVPIKHVPRHLCVAGSRRDGSTRCGDLRASLK
jgi:hypothetical protein